MVDKNPERINAEAILDDIILTDPIIAPQVEIALDNPVMRKLILYTVACYRYKQIKSDSDAEARIALRFKGYSLITDYVELANDIQDTLKSSRLSSRMNVTDSVTKTPIRYSNNDIELFRENLMSLREILADNWGRISTAYGIEYDGKKDAEAKQLIYAMSVIRTDERLSCFHPLIDHFLGKYKQFKNEAELIPKDAPIRVNHTIKS